MHCLTFVFLREIKIDHGENVMFVETGLILNNILDKVKNKIT